jgi:hypothetical protein
MSFRVEKSLVGYPNLAEILIYNLDSNYRDAIEEKDLQIYFHAGHEDTGDFSLFSGQTTNVIHEYVKPDWQSRIFASDAERGINSSTIQKSLPEGLNSEQIFDELVGQMEGVTKGLIAGLSNCVTGKKSLLRKLILSGDVRKWLNQLAKDCGFDYSINDGVIETTETGKPLFDVPSIIINQASIPPMIEAPERTEIGANVKTLLYPQAKLARRFKIEATTTKINIGNLFFRSVPPVKNQGVYRIEKLIHIGDTHAQPWFTHFFGRYFSG